MRFDFTCKLCGREHTDLLPCAEAPTIIRHHACYCSDLPTDVMCDFCWKLRSHCGDVSCLPCNYEDYRSHMVSNGEDAVTFEHWQRMRELTKQQAESHDRVVTSWGAQ